MRIATVIPGGSRRAKRPPLPPETQVSLRRPQTRPAASPTPGVGLPISGPERSGGDCPSSSSLIPHLGDSVVKVPGFRSLRISVLLPVVLVTKLHPIRSLVNSFLEKFQRPRIFPGQRVDSEPSGHGYVRDWLLDRGYPLIQFEVPMLAHVNTVPRTVRF